jgi:Fe2+ transport system protein FeoA
LDLGVVAGTHIRCERFGPSNASSIYEVRSTRLVIRHSDGAYVLAQVD